MSVKFYIFLWCTAALIATVFYLSGNFTLLTGVVFGFVWFGLTFMGMISVLPTTVHSDMEPHAPAEETVRVSESRSRIMKIFREFKAAWGANGVEVHKPKYR